MKTCLLKSTLSIFLFTVIFGCSKSDLKENDARNNVLDKLRKPSLSGFIVNSRSYHGQNYFPDRPYSSKNKETSTRAGNRRLDPIMWTYRDGPGLIASAIDPEIQKAVLFYQQKYKSQMFTIADQSMALNIYPGAILDGRSIEGIFEPRMLQGISANIRPVTISTSMPVSGSAVAKTSLPRPIAERALLNAALTDLERENPGGTGAASLQLELDSITVYEELKTLYGYNKNIDVFLVNSNTVKQGDNHLITARSAIKLKFFQQNFTIDLDVPNSYNELFDPTGLDLNQITGGVTPVYVKSVTYGRMGIMLIESDRSADKVYSAVYKQLGILKNLIGIDKHLTEEEKTIINNADIKVKYTGVGKDTDGTIKVNGLQGFIDILSGNQTYSKDSPGVPVAFQLAYLDNNHGIVEAPFQINYGPFDKPYVGLGVENRDSEETYRRGHHTTWRFYYDVYLRFYAGPDSNDLSTSTIPDFLQFKYTINSKHSLADLLNGENDVLSTQTTHILTKLNTPNYLLFKRYLYKDELEIKNIIIENPDEPFPAPGSEHVLQTQEYEIKLLPSEYYVTRY